MGTQHTTLSRPLTPESPLTSSLYRASNTVDDLTLALSNFSRVPSPEPPTNLTCCCGSEECDNAQAWHALKSRLESRLTLSAEVGQALLQRHEAYVRRHEVKCRIKRIHENHQQNGVGDIEDEGDAAKVLQEQLDERLAELEKEKELLEKRLNQALVNNEVTEVSSKTLLQELQDAQATISRLTAHHARSIGWDTRLTAALKERDDMQQERDSESHRARLAESRFAALKDKTIKLQTEVRRLQEALEEKRSHRLESSETLLQDVRTRLESIREVGHYQTMDGYEEITRILESLVQNNETLKHDNNELQHLLSESREDFAALQEEYEEYKANPPSVPRSGANTPHTRHLRKPSIASIASRDYTDRKSRRSFEPLTPDTNRPLSPADSYLAPDTKWTPLSRTSSPRSPSHYGFEIEAPNDDQETSSMAEKRRSHKPLLLLSRSRGVQTEPYPPSLTSPPLVPSLIPSLSPHDRSETSSFSDSSSSQMASLIERVLSLLSRMTQADPLTLTNRLKRQNLKGADIGHLSRTTIGNVLNEVNNLRLQYRSLLEEDKATLSVNRKDLRLLFRFLKDIFTELGDIRTTLNEVILDPSLAPKISEHALNPSQEGAVDKDNTNPSAQSWIAPISRLFSPQRVMHPQQATLSSPTNSRPRNTRFVPKSGPALAASATTVNVEFSGVGGRSTTSATALPVALQAPPVEGTSGLMDIFAGAPALSTSTSTSTDTWIVVPPPTVPRRMTSMRFGLGAAEDPSASSTADAIRTIGRNTILSMPKAEIPRNVDAVIDERAEADDLVSPLLQRTLRRRGLSDSSIHSTFSSHGRETQPAGENSSSRVAPKQFADVFRAAWPDGSSVLQALSRTVQNLKIGGTTSSGSEPNLTARNDPPLPNPISSSASEPQATETMTGTQSPSALVPPTQTQAQGTSPPVMASPSRATHVNTPKKKKSAMLSPRKSKVSDFSSWATASLMLDPVDGISDPYVARNVVGSLREESFLQRTHRPGDEV